MSVCVIVFATNPLISLLDPEPAYYQKSTYLGEKSILALGVVQAVIDDGKIAMEVKKTTKDSIVCTVQNGGEVSNHKSLNVPDVSIPMDFISPSDRSDLLFGIEEGVDFVAASFTRRADDVLAVRKLLDENGGNKIKIIRR